VLSVSRHLGLLVDLQDCLPYLMPVVVARLGESTNKTACTGTCMYVGMYVCMYAVFVPGLQVEWILDMV